MSVDNFKIHLFPSMVGVPVDQILSSRKIIMFVFVLVSVKKEISSDICN